MKASIRDALNEGFFAIDCAEMYSNQRAVGEALAEFLAYEAQNHEADPVTRQNLFITSKVANSSREPAAARAAAEAAIAELGVGYLDLLLIHSPFGAPCPLGETWAAMEALVREGKVRHLGVSNFRIADLEAILATCTIRPVNNQIECHPALPQPALRGFCEAHGITLSTYGGLVPLTKRPPACDALLACLASLGGDPADLLLRWQLAAGRAVVTTSSQRARMAAFRGALEPRELPPGALFAISAAGVAGGGFRQFWQSDFGAFVE
jgi:diketogulonate reductase-like aldo/keto reductase